VFAKVEGSLRTVQEYYTPLVEAAVGVGPPEKVRLALVAADTTLLLAGELQRQWCPDPSKAQQLELQVQEAQKLAQEAGVAPTESPGGMAPGKSGE
jgi:hypothetical protein